MDQYIIDNMPDDNMPEPTTSTSHLTLVSTTADDQSITLDVIENEYGVFHLIGSTGTPSKGEVTGIRLATFEPDVDLSTILSLMVTIKTSQLAGASEQAKAALTELMAS